MMIFDFDGVLINSLDEVALTAFNAVTGNLFTSMAEIPGAPVALFKRNRFHVQQIGDAIALMNWSLENHQFDSTRILSMEKYRTVAVGDTAMLNFRTNLIYETRHRGLRLTFKDVAFNAFKAGFKFSILL